MALQIIEQLPAYNRPYPKVGCGLKFCFEENDFVVTLGTQSYIDIVLNLLGGPIVDGDTLELHGFTFTFVSGTPAHLFEIAIGAAITDPALNLFTNLNLIPFFIDNYIITNPPHQVILVSNNALLDENYFYNSNTVNVDAIVLNPFAPNTAGSNPIFKEDYYLFFDIIANPNTTRDKLCTEALERPLNVFSNGTNKVCVNVQPIIENYPEIFTHPPTPFQPVISPPNRPDNFDENYFADFELRFWNSYKDPDPSAENCEKVQSDFYEIPVGSQVLRIANFAQKQVDCSINGFAPYSFPPANPFEQKFITAMPADYKICQDTAIEWRFDYPVELINFLGGVVQFGYIVIYKDGSNLIGVIDWDTNQDGCQVLNLSFGDNPNATIPTDPTKKIATVFVQVYHVLFATQFEWLETRTIHFDHSKSRKVKCCEDHVHLYFLSCVGNNDVVIAKETQQTLDVEHYTFCKEQVCCGTERLGVKQQTGGRVTTGIKEEEKIHRVIIESDNVDYIEDFLLSAFKYVYEPETDSIFQIVPTKNSFTIWQKNFRNIIEFTFFKGYLRPRLKL